MRERLLSDPEEFIEILRLVTDHRVSKSDEKYSDEDIFGMNGDVVRDVMSKPYYIYQKVLEENIKANNLSIHNLDYVISYYNINILKESLISSRDNKRLAIRDVVEKKEISNVIHFTRIENLKNILEKGVISRNKLHEDEQVFSFNDHYRWDEKTDYSCFSIEFPNIEMLRALEYKTSNKNWAILVFDSQILYNYDCLFYYTNAASNEVRHKNIKEFEDAAALEKLFSWEQDNRPHYLCINDPTDVQSEVMIKDNVDIKYLKFCCINNADFFSQFQHEYPNVNFQYNPVRTRLFNTRYAYNCGY